MTQAKLEEHKHWKHVKTGKLAVLFGYGLWKGGEQEPAGDMAEVIVMRPVGCDGLSDLDVVPAGFNMTMVDVKTADAAKVQSDAPLTADEQLIAYECNGGVWVSPVTRFFDGRFVKTDEGGTELTSTPAAKMVKRDTMQQFGSPGEEH